MSTRPLPFPLPPSYVTAYNAASAPQQDFFITVWTQTLYQLRFTNQVFSNAYNTGLLSLSNGQNNFLISQLTELAQRTINIGGFVSCSWGEHLLMNFLFQLYGTPERVQFAMTRAHNFVRVTAYVPATGLPVANPA